MTPLKKTAWLKQTKRLASLVLAAALTLPVWGGAGNLTASAAVIATSPTSPVSHYDYFRDAYPSLANVNSHVFKTVTYEDLVTIFESQGTFALLIGGAWSAETQADIGYLNEAAKEYGIRTVYNFDTKLDGKDLQIADSANKYSHYYVDLVNKYLTNLATIYDKADGDAGHNVSYTNADGKTVTASKLQAPFLLVYDKDRKAADGTPAPIVASLEKHGANGSLSYDASYFADPAHVADYKAKVKAVLSKVPAADYDTLNNWNFIGNAFNKTFWKENPTYDPAVADGKKKVTIFTQGVDNYDVFEHVTYDQLIRLLQTDGNYVILFGGSWCPNTQADIRFIANQAKAKGIDKIYFWDTKLTAGVDVASTLHPHNNEELQVRANNHDYAYLYGDLVTTYLPNIKTQNKSAANPTQITYTKNDVTYKADRLQVPYLFAYNKNNKDADGVTAAPVLGHIELMYSWTGTSSNVDPAYEFGNDADGKPIPGGFNHTALIAGIDSLYSRLEAVPTGLAGAAPATRQSGDGQITGVKNKALEYKRAGDPDSAYQAVDSSQNAITGLSAGVYTVRYKAKPGYQGPVSVRVNNVSYPVAPAAISYNAGPSVDIVVGSPISFADVPQGSWYAEAVNYLTVRGIASGTDETHFSPEAALTRGQFIVLLLKAYGIQPAEAGADNFADAGDTFYTDYLAAAKIEGIATGVGDNKFAPERALTRQDLFALLYRSLNLLGKLPTGNTGVAVDSFEDASQIADYAREAVQAFLESGIISGGNAKLDPQGIATRAQTAQVLYNLLSK